MCVIAAIHWKQLKRPLAGKWLNKLRSTQAIKYYAGGEEKELVHLCWLAERLQRAVKWETKNKKAEECEVKVAFTL